MKNSFCYSGHLILLFVCAFVYYCGILVVMFVCLFLLFCLLFTSQQWRLILLSCRVFSKRSADPCLPCRSADSITVMKWLAPPLLFSGESFVYKNGCRAQPWRQLHGDISYIEAKPHDGDKVLYITANTSGYFINKVSRKASLHGLAVSEFWQHLNFV